MNIARALVNMHKKGVITHSPRRLLYIHHQRQIAEQTHNRNRK
jgi:hypothetical protein